MKRSGGKSEQRVSHGKDETRRECDGSPGEHFAERGGQQRGQVEDAHEGAENDPSGGGGCLHLGQRVREYDAETQKGSND